MGCFDLLFEQSINFPGNFSSQNPELLGVEPLIYAHMLIVFDLIVVKQTRFLDIDLGQGKL